MNEINEYVLFGKLHPMPLFLDTLDGPVMQWSVTSVSATQMLQFIVGEFTKA